MNEYYESYSHWGMFPCQRRFFVVPRGFKIDEEKMGEWLRADGIIWLKPE